MRKLATIRKVSEINSIEGADNIELAHIDGWQCIVKKGEVKVNELAVYFEIDSLLPCKEPFLFLESRGRKTNDEGFEGYRLRTIKMKGVLSQGLLLPIKDIFNTGELILQEGEDVTDIIGVKKYEPPVPAQLSGQVKRNFPEFIRKTDQERIQNLPEFFEKHKNTSFEVTEKVDGSSATYYFNNGEFGICSRNLELKINDDNKDNAFVRMSLIADIENHLRNLGMNLAFQGEIVGPGIQKNRLQLKENMFFLYDIDNQKYLLPEVRWDIYTNLKVNSYFQHVPIAVAHKKIFDECNKMEELLNYAEIDKSLVTPNLEREGVVFKSNEYIHGQIISFKAINNNYLLKEK